MSTYRLDLRLTVVGPFLVGATGLESYGIDKAFHRDFHQRPAVPGSHIRGKLRAALSELNGDGRFALTDLFGAESAEGSYTPVPGRLRFSDLSVSDVTEPRERHRVAMDHASGTAAEKLLRTVEDPYASGEEVTCSGTITYDAASAQAAREIARSLWVGLRWMTGMGGQKGVGYGRLIRASLAGPDVMPVPSVTFQPKAGLTQMHLVIRPSEPLLVGGVKKPRSNFVFSERELSGGLIKGALAMALNRSYRPKHLNCPLTAENANDYPGYEALVSHFSGIRITHAFPAHVGQPRPVRMPASTAYFGEHLLDTALPDSGRPLVCGQAPAYFPDWKQPKDYIGAASPSSVAMTRTKIHERAWRASNEQLFTNVAMAPRDDDGEVAWVCNVDFCGVSAEERDEVVAQFALAVARHLHRLGKRSAAVAVELIDGLAPAAVGSYSAIKDGLAIVMLQTEAIVLDPDAVRALSPDADLKDLYAAYWDAISQVDGEPCLALEDFWAHQLFKGGYLYHRYLGSAERPQKGYRPYFLTGAGSVFRLKVVDASAANEILKGWLSGGLALPAWAVTQYTKPGYALWQTCPFVPENGYGEIAVNLKWHWNKVPGSPAPGVGE